MAFIKNNPIKNNTFQRLIKHISDNYQIGIHPSYASNNDDKELAKEVKQLESILNRKIEISRQHYLKLHLPDTYQALLALGIKKDYTMGYADAGGFRASIATACRWYDLQQNLKTW